ncbi:alpha/beta fold hydrolase [Sphingosinicella sp. LHD-64]|uniref:alpha/beta hydrolase n=1 Tax=Sphingosinicella sp. LHD-64 TaxID=3072139 RepID=UPI00280CD245|nr:alpha/beta fold hydrolase [Sphingosinicella sp. LHD-64]MDQ8756228.1 alpha/beta fold hydrolase [Sphingosinicella sp. LHD-64]
MSGSIPALALRSPLAQIPAAVIADPARDRVHPARNDQLLLPSQGVGMNALFLRAAGQGRRPTMLLLHGLPGNERNLDLAQAVRRAGWNVLTFTYRGAWGSPGTFSIAGAIEDADAALSFLRSPDAAARYNVDAERIVVAGHSMGGLAAALLARRGRPVHGIVLIDAWNAALVGDELVRNGPQWRSQFEASMDLGHSLNGATPASLADEIAAHRTDWNLMDAAPALARGQVLNVYATHGGAAENRALTAAIHGLGGADLTVVEIETDHSFTDRRIALAGVVVSWLDELETVD